MTRSSAGKRHLPGLRNAWPGFTGRFAIGVVASLQRKAAGGKACLLRCLVQGIPVEGSTPMQRIPVLASPRSESSTATPTTTPAPSARSGAPGSVTTSAPVLRAPGGLAPRGAAASAASAPPRGTAPAAGAAVNRMSITSLLNDEPSAGVPPATSDAGGAATTGPAPRGTTTQPAQAPAGPIRRGNATAARGRQSVTIGVGGMPRQAAPGSRIVATSLVVAPWQPGASGVVPLGRVSRPRAQFLGANRTDVTTMEAGLRNAGRQGRYIDTIVRSLASLSLFIGPHVRLRDFHANLQRNDVQAVQLLTSFLQNERHGASNRSYAQRALDLLAHYNP
jgi:hypothetical protein